MATTILVTGGAGYIGSHTAFLLSKQGYRVIVLDNLLQGQKFNHPWATFAQEDFADAQTLNDLFTHYTIDAVMHFAAHIEVGESVKNPLKFYNNNVTKTLTLLETMITHNVKKIIFSSSCAVYGIPQSTPISESHQKQPFSPYGKNKRMVEMVLKDLHIAYGLDYVSLRYFNAAGALPEEGLGEQHSPESHIIPLLINAAQKEKPFFIFGTDYPTKDGTCVRDYLHVLDLGAAHIAALQHLEAEKPSDSFNLGTGCGFSVKEMINAVETITEKPINAVISSRRAGDPPALIADPTRANTILSWKPQYSDLNFIIRSAYQYQKIHGYHHEYVQRKSMEKIT